MKTLETRIVSWIESKLNPPQPKQMPKDNFVTDYLVLRLNYLITLREAARKKVCDKLRNGEPYDVTKIKQADFLIKQVTDRLNSRPYTTIYSMN